ncbi:DUF2273 domain-containing protein [Enterococcus timonensis]|uniref:DUF2273 domain-containing protein n=1 Tax=Enterococcus timonensis TaxID=1852364 RepID=UPI0008D92F45|nr:DUF2273 domain-containing protein [Enterococcus timonensis]
MLKNIFMMYRLPILCGALALLLGILWFTVGFFKTLFLIILICLGVAGGFYLEKTGILDRFKRY